MCSAVDVSKQMHALRQRGLQRMNAKAQIVRKHILMPLASVQGRTFELEIKKEGRLGSAARVMFCTLLYKGRGFWEMQHLISLRV